LGQESFMTTCGVCNSGAAKYSCPRCVMQYCSVACFKGHSVSCVARFHEENLVQLMRGEVVSSEVREAMNGALQREMEEAREEQEEEQEEQDLLRVLEAVEQSDFDLKSFPLYLREQFEREMAETLNENEAL
jgi:diphthamide synthase (EF-2-diphthine--ammonia ligase)